jgi:hypothetical protein
VLDRKLIILYILVDCVLTSISKVQQVGKLDGIPLSVKMKAKIVYCYTEDYGNNIVEAKDNNANGINEMAFMLWDIIASCESKHIWKMAKETCVDVFGLVSRMAYFA